MGRAITFASAGGTTQTQRGHMQNTPDTTINWEDSDMGTGERTGHSRKRVVIAAAAGAVLVAAGVGGYAYYQHRLTTAVCFVLLATATLVYYSRFAQRRIRTRR